MNAAKLGSTLLASSDAYVATAGLAVYEVYDCPLYDTALHSSPSSLRMQNLS